jgi:hypothetical protein
MLHGDCHRERPPIWTRSGSGRVCLHRMSSLVAKLNVPSYIGGNLIEGGADTTSAFLQTLILALVNFPDVQLRAQEELDSVIGDERSPQPDDIERLPYIQAVIKEVRCRITMFPNRLTSFSRRHTAGGPSPLQLFRMQTTRTLPTRATLSLKGPSSLLTPVGASSDITARKR